MTIVHIESCHLAGTPVYAFSSARHEGIDLWLLKIAPVRWSIGLQQYYIEQSAITFEELRNHLEALPAQVVYTRVRTKTGAMPPPYPPEPPSLPPHPPYQECLKDYTDYLGGLRMSPSTIKVYHGFLSSFLDWLKDVPLDQIDDTHVRKFIEAYLVPRGYSVSTHRQFISAIKHFAFFYPDCLVDPGNLQRPKASKYLPTVLSEQEVIRLLQVTRNLKHRMAIAMLYSAGLRISELLQMELSNLDLDRRQVIIKQAKGRKDRVVVLAASVLPLLKNYLRSYQPRHYLIENPNGGPYNDGSVRQFLKQQVKRAGITKKVTPHTLRHSYATHLIEQGVGLRHVQELLGHAKPETTMIYTHIARKDLLAIKSPLDRAVEAYIETDKKQSNPRLPPSGNR
ncbi:tyrosine-type recombinase/integrase [Croceiramulus getboli]|nr:tyrosine-type recombinase/integrase [Flavobacteriaceae bacterium YJPT1-3]